LAVKGRERRASEGRKGDMWDMAVLLVRGFFPEHSLGRVDDGKLMTHN